jgi:prevent-host-death family protein
MQRTSISIRELQQNLNRVLARVERGQVIDVTRRRRPVARLAPLRSDGPASPWPDLDARAREVFGTRVVTPGGGRRGPGGARRPVTTYVDSSALVPVYVPERFLKSARRALRSSPQVPFTPLHELEVPNAFALLPGRALISDADRGIRL